MRIWDSQGCSRERRVFCFGFSSCVLPDESVIYVEIFVLNCDFRRVYSRGIEVK